MTPIQASATISSTPAPRGRAGAILAALGLLIVLSGCVVYPAYGPPPPRYYYHPYYWH
jgi:hypothetical protein